MDISQPLQLERSFHLGSMLFINSQNLLLHLLYFPRCICRIFPELKKGEISKVIPEAVVVSLLLFPYRHGQQEIELQMGIAGNIL